MWIERDSSVVNNVYKTVEPMPTNGENHVITLQVVTSPH